MSKENQEKTEQTKTVTVNTTDQGNIQPGSSDTNLNENNLEGQINRTASEAGQQQNAIIAELERQKAVLQAERDNALQAVRDMSSQLSDQSKVNADSDIAVKVGKISYTLKKGIYHTPEGPLSAEDIARDQDLLKDLIERKSGLITLAN